MISKILSQEVQRGSQTCSHRYVEVNCMLLFDTAATNRRGTPKHIYVQLELT